MTKQIRWTALLAAAAAIAGCGNSDDGGTVGGGDDNRLSCTASLSPTTFSYVLDATGQSMTVNAGQADGVTLGRVGAPSGTIYGSWSPPDSVQGDATLHFELQFDANPDEFTTAVTCSALGKTARAAVSSPVTITASSVTVLQADSDVEYSD